MDKTLQLIEDNRQKLYYLHSYLELNRRIEEKMLERDFDSASLLIQKKRGLMTGIHVIDEKIIRRIAELKKDCGIEDLSELDIAENPNLRELKSLAMEVLKKMVEAKESDADLAGLSEKSTEESTL